MATPNNGTEEVALRAQDFEKGDQIGAGTGGEVFQGVWTTNELPVAMKKLFHISDAQSPEICREVTTLSKLRHPNIISYYGTVGLVDGYYIVTELAEKRSLLDFLRNNPDPDLERSFRWATEIARGVEYLHQFKYIHRDLKSGNVLLMEDLTAKICDFGSAKQVQMENVSTVQTSRTGTYQWRSPEAIRGEKVSSSWDVYSYGIMLWELVTHKIPFSHLNLRIPGKEFELQTKISDGERPPIPDSCDPNLASLMRHCWAEDPGSRPTFTEILTALEGGTEEVALQAQDFEKGDQIGTGTGGVVFRGVWTTKALPVAMKRLCVGGAQGLEIHREVTILSKLRHSTIISYYGTVTLVDGYYIVTELAEKGSLWDFLQKNPDPDLQRSFRWAKQIARGVEYLHQHKCIHRDLKSGNVLLMEDLTAKICDFGSAKHVQAENISTVQSSPTGTYQWRSPEAIHGDKVSSSWDVYSYAILLWELVTHKIPFSHLNLRIPGQEYQLQKKISNGERPPIPDSCDPSLALLMRLCWAEDPGSRPTFAEILTALEGSENVDSDISGVRFAGATVTEGVVPSSLQDEMPMVGCSGSTGVKDEILSTTPPKDVPVVPQTPEPSAAQATPKTMAEHESLDYTVIQGNFVYLSKKLPPDDVAPEMLTTDLLTPEEYAAYLVMKTQRTSSDLSTYLLQCLLKREPGSLHKLCAILRDIGPSVFLADFLEEARRKAIEDESGDDDSPDRHVADTAVDHAMQPIPQVPVRSLVGHRDSTEDHVEDDFALTLEQASPVPESRASHAASSKDSGVSVEEQAQDEGKFANALGTSKIGQQSDTEDPLQKVWQKMSQQDQKIAQQDQKLTDQGRELRDVKSKVQNHVEMHKKHETEAQKLRKKLEKQEEVRRAQDKQIEGLQQKVKQLNKELQSQRADFEEQLQDEREKNRTQRADFERQLDELKQKNRTQRRDYERQLEEEEEKYQKQLETQREDFDRQLEEEKEQMKEQLMNSIADTVKELEDTKRELELSEISRKQLQDENVALKSQLEGQSAHSYQEHQGFPLPPPPPYDDRRENPASRSVQPSVPGGSDSALRVQGPVSHEQPSVGSRRPNPAGDPNQDDGHVPTSEDEDVSEDPQCTLPEDNQSSP